MSSFLTGSEHFGLACVGSAIAVASEIVDMGEGAGESHELRTGVYLQYSMVARG
jgi:hypothetical protein